MKTTVATECRTCGCERGAADRCMVCGESKAAADAARDARNLAAMESCRLRFEETGEAGYGY